MPAKAKTPEDTPAINFKSYVIAEGGYRATWDDARCIADVVARLNRKAVGDDVDPAVMFDAANAVVEPWRKGKRVLIPISYEGLLWLKNCEATLLTPDGKKNIM